MMKKVQKLLTLGLCLALGAGALVACGNKGGGSGDGYAEGDLTDYWLAGKIKGVDAWDEKNADGENLVSDSVRFVASAESGVYTLTLDMWKEDQFKIRYLGRGWDDEGGQVNAQANFDSEGDTVKNIIPVNDGVGGETNFGVQTEGEYVITLDVNGEVPMVTYERKGDATVKAPILATDVVLKDANDDDGEALTAISLHVGDTLQLSATVTPDNTTNKTVTYSSSNTDCFTVSATGLITAVAMPEEEDGEVEQLELYVNVGSQVALKTVSVTIQPAGAVDVTGLTIPTAQKTFTGKHVGDTVSVTPEITPANATTKTVTYTSSDPEIVNVVSGVITAVGPGTATITATADGGNNVKDTFTVTVEPTFYLRGQNANGKFNWDPKVTTIAGATGIKFEQDDTDATKYTLTGINLYEGDAFKIAVVGAKGNNAPAAGQAGGYDNGWVGAYGFSSGTIADGMVVSTEANGNISVTAEGKYTLTLTIPADGDATLVFERTDDADPVALTCDLYINGNWDSSWGQKVLCAENLSSANNYTATFTVELTNTNTECGLLSTLHGSTTQHMFQNNNGAGGVTVTLNGDPVSGNFNLAQGKYTFTVVINEEGKFVSVTVVTAAADATVDATAPAPAAA